MREIAARLAGSDSLHPRSLVWVAVSALAALVAYFAFRGYLNPELLYNFANTFYC